MSVKWWIRNVSVGAAVGLAAGLVVGGTLGRAFMRILFLAREDTLGFQTAMGALVGDFTGDGTAAIYVFAALSGTALGVAYAIGRTLLPSRARVRATLFTLATILFMVGQITRGNRDDFTFLPVTLSLVLVTASVAVTALPVPLLVERLAPDRERRPTRLARGIVTAALVGFVAFAATGVAIAYDQPVAERLDVNWTRSEAVSGEVHEAAFRARSRFTSSL